VLRSFHARPIATDGKDIVPKTKLISKKTPVAGATVSPVGSTHRAAGRRRAQRSAAYRKEFARIAPYEGIARIVIARRQALDLTQQELAERVGTSHSVISRIESGQRPTSVTTLRRLAEAFETHLVVGFEDQPEKASGLQLVAVS
jgi:ribosome-binding protein aMBF1 (putative translation factor)